MRINTFLQLRRADRRIVIARAAVILLMIANLAFIWYNSAQIAEDSTKISESVTESVAPHLVEGYDEMPEQEKETQLKKLNGKIRICAHSLEFVPLGMLIFFLGILLFEIKRNQKNMVFLIALSLIFAFLCALSDEVHQIFVDGRTFEIKDLGFDMLGMSVGYILGGIAYKLIFKKRRSV